MSTEESPKGKIPVTRPEKTTKATNNKARSRAKDEEKVAEPQVEAPVTARVEEQVKAEPVLTEALETSDIPQAEVEPEPQAGQARNAPTEQERVAEIEVEKMKLALATPEEGATEQRVSFVVRLTVDQRSQPRRTEVEHVHSGQKETFPGLDVQRLAAFMQACLGSHLVPELASSPAPVSRTTSPGLLSAAARLIVSEVRLSLTEDFTSRLALILNSTKAFMIQTRFQLQGQEAALLTTQASYEIQVYAHEMSGGKSTFLMSYKEALVKDVLEYTSQIQAPGLPPGLYRLVTLVNLQGPVKLTGHYQGPIIQVLGVREPASELPVVQT